MEIYILGGKEISYEQLSALSYSVYQQVADKLGLKSMNIKREYKKSIDMCEEYEYVEELRLDYVRTFYSAVKTVDINAHYTDVAITADVVSLASDVTKALVGIAKNVYCLADDLTGGEVNRGNIIDYIGNLRIMYYIELMSYKSGKSRLDTVMDYLASENVSFIPQSQYEVDNVITYSMVEKELGKLEVTIR